MLEKYCDILVIGDNLPGLVTAAFLARRGLSVQVIDSDLFSGHEKNPDPVCSNKIHSTLLRSILGRLNVPETTIQNLLNQDSTLQTIFPRHRIDIFNNPLDYFEELEREFPDHYPDIKKFYENQSKLRHRTNVTDLFEQLIPSGWQEKRKLKKFIQTQSLNEKNSEYTKLLKKDPHIKSYFLAQYLMAYQHFCNNPFSYQVSALFNPGDGEIFGVHAGLNSFKKVLHERITHYDGSIRNKVQVNSLLYRNGVLEGVELDESHGHVLCKYVIWNDSLDKLKELLPNKWRFRTLRKNCVSNQIDFHWFTTRFSVDTNYLPELLKSNAVVIKNPKKELVGDNFLYIQTKANKIEPKTVLSVNFLLPKSALTEEEEFFDQYFDAIKQSLINLMPFSDDSIEFQFPVKSKNMPTDTLFPLNENDFEIFRHSASNNGVTTQNERSFVNLFKLNYTTPSPNFYISHPSIFAGFGLDSKLMLGLKITDLIWQEVEKVKKRAMKTERRIA